MRKLFLKPTYINSKNKSLPLSFHLSVYLIIVNYYHHVIVIIFTYCDLLGYFFISVHSAHLLQHIEDLTQEKFSLQRALDTSRALAESLAAENSSLTESYNQQVRYLIMSWSEAAAMYLKS